MSFSPLIDELIASLRCLPGVGPKSAQRMAFHLLERGREQAKLLASSLERASTLIKHCTHCNTFTENELCNLCASQHRNQSLLCIVESPIDVLALEQSGSFNGVYFVLMGHLSPIDGIGPEELGIEKLKQRLAAHRFSEVILATNPTVEGEATAHYIAELVQHFGIPASRIAHGVPLGGELEYIDGSTLARALSSREPIKAAADIS